VLNKSRLLGSLNGLTTAVALCMLSACQGNVIGVNGSVTGMGNGGGSAGGASTQTGGSGVDAPIAQLDCTNHAVDPGPSPMRLLTREQYLGTVQALAGDVSGLDAALGASVDASAFGLVQPHVTQVELEHFQKAADAIARAIAGNQAALDKAAPCAAGTAPAECARSAVQKFGARVYRAPISDAADIERHVQLFNVGAATSYAYGMELLLRGMLQSPRFLYRVEVGTSEKVGDKAVKLSPYEVAARLSYTLWGTMPDEQLAQAAASGGLASKEGVAAQLATMLADARGQKVMSRFLEGWTHVAAVDGLVKNPDTYPEFQQASFRASLRAQASAFFDDLLKNQGGKLNALFTSPTVFFNKDLGAYYGVTGGDTFQALQRTDGTAAGILTLPAVLAVQGKPNESSPIYRGRFVREALLCQQLPAPPADIPAAPEVTAGVSTRERLAQHEVDPNCSGCHKLLDPLGFGFENFDTLGRYRTQDGGKPVDASGSVSLTRDIDGPFNGVAELAAKLAQSQEVKECVARQWFRFVLNRSEESSDGCSMKAMIESFDAAGQSLNALPKAVLETDAFLLRRPTDAQVKP
jgi:hypothetical protein